jgi:hypothetical protein
LDPPEQTINARVLDGTIITVPGYTTTTASDGSNSFQSGCERHQRRQTVIAWHRQGSRLYWKWKSRVRHGRPSAPTEVQNLIQKMSSANPHWGAPRIHGELLKLAIHLAQATVAKCMVRHRKPPSQTWRTFLENHAKELVSTEFFTAPGGATPTIRELLIAAQIGMTAPGENHSRAADCCFA